MGKRRGFLAEMQHQARLAEQRQRAAARQQQAAVRKAQQAQRAADRAEAAAARATEQDRKRLAREAKEAHIAAKKAEVENLNLALSEHFNELDNILIDTLTVDDFVDLEALKIEVKHPSFPEAWLRIPIPEPTPIPDPAYPVRMPINPPKGLFGKKKKLAEAQANAERDYQQACHNWQKTVEELPRQRVRQAEQHASEERARLQKLASAEKKYQSECAEREREAADHNDAIDRLIVGLGYGTIDAVQEYVGIVLANSVYPDSFPVQSQSYFEPETAEIALNVIVPDPDVISTVKSYSYIQKSDTIKPAHLSQKGLKDRYSHVVASVALRCVHEIFEADRREIIKRISLELGTHAVSPATGREEYVPFIALSVNRDKFGELDLSAVVPSAALQHLGASVSKNPYELVAADTSGIRSM